jgi:DNA-directed RNA polymerase subunit RPC12/RpoP
MASQEFYVCSECGRRTGADNPPDDADQCKGCGGGKFILQRLPHRVVVSVSGGLVQAVFSDLPADSIQVLVVDHDNLHGADNWDDIPPSSEWVLPISDMAGETLNAVRLADEQLPICVRCKNEFPIEIRMASTNHVDIEYCSQACRAARYDDYKKEEV